ncbi:MAG: ABC transporter ATP-binding protein [Nitrospirota bacterium]|nr:MAG: ABC transporter ATP-binding protein [Nitrospirota bacterium]
MSSSIIRIEDVTKVFHSRKGNVEAVRGFSLDVHKGEVVTLVGSSGCGKTTILNMVAGFIRPTSGTVFLEDSPINKIEPRCGMIFQSYALFPWLTVKENVEFGPRINGIPGIKRNDEAGRYIDMVGLEGFEDSYPGELSGGMRQRVALCRALANEPDILLCDEPFAALDAMTRQVMQQELLQIVGRSGQTVLFITHSIDEALVLSDRVVVMSARPGQVKDKFKIDLPHPRKVDIQLTDDFLALKRNIWDLVEEEVRASMKI